MKTIAVIDPALYGGLNKILSFLAIDKESSDSLAINNGVLVDVVNTGFIRADLRELFAENSIEFLDPVRSTKLMSLLKGGEEFVFLDDEENNKYHITNVISSVSIPKALNSKTVTIPELNETLATLKIDDKVAGNIADAQKTLAAEKIILELKDDLSAIVGVNINDVYEYKFDTEYQGETKKYNLFNFRPIKGSEYTFNIMRKDGELWIKTIIDLDLIEVEYYEKLVEASQFNAFTLY